MGNIRGNVLRGVGKGAERKGGGGGGGRGNVLRGWGRGRKGKGDGRRGKEKKRGSGKVKLR